MRIIKQTKYCSILNYDLLCHFLVIFTNQCYHILLNYYGLLTLNIVQLLCMNLIQNNFSKTNIIFN